MNFKYYSICHSIPADECIDEEDNWIEFPDFDKIIWPFIKNNIDRFEKICLFNNKNSTLYQWFIKRYLKRKIKFDDFNIYELIEFDISNNNVNDLLYSLTSHNGYLNTLYFSSDIKLMREFVNLFPKPYQIGYMNDDLGLSNEIDNNNFNNFLDKKDDESFCISSLCEETLWIIIGNESIIKQLSSNL